MKKSKLAAIGITTVFLLSGCQNDTAVRQNDELQQQISELQQQVSNLQQELSAETEAKKTLEGLLASSRFIPAEDAQGSESSDNQTSTQPQGSQDAVQSSTQQQNNQNTQPTQQQSAANITSTHHDEPHHTGSSQPSADTSSQTSNNTTAQAQQPQAENTDTQPAASQTNNTQSATAQTKLDELTATVDSFTNDVASILASSANKTIEQFFTYKQTAEQIDNSLDQYEDWLEAQYNQKAMTRDEYKSYERALDKLEDKLDAAEDNLEYGFGIDD